MGLSNKQTISIGLPNESAGSDSLYAAFTKINTNFDNIFSNAISTGNVQGSNGVSVTANSSTVVISANLVAGNNITLTTTGNAITIDANTGGGGGGNVNSVQVVGAGSNARITSTGGPITSNGTISLDLATTGVGAATYTNPTLQIDAYGRIISASNNTVSGTVTSVGITPGTGIQVTGGPITSNGSITVTNTGVTRLNAGTGITLSGSNGDVTISGPASIGTVTSIGITSNTLTVSPSSPITSAGTLSVNLPNSISLTGNVTSNNIITNIIKTTPVAYANLPLANAIGSGARAMITDANTATFYSVVGSGGSNIVPVFSDGTDWRIG